MCKLTRGERFKDARTVHNQNGNQSMDEVYTATGVAASMIKDLEDDDKNRSVGYEKIAALAKHYGVSSDYLLGLSPNPTTNKDIDAVCKFTGLTEKNIIYLNEHHIDSTKSIERVGTYSQTTLALVNDLISLCQCGNITAYFWQMLGKIRRIKEKGYSGDVMCGQPTNDDVSRFINENGLTVLPLRLGLEYDIQRIADEIKKELMAKYTEPLD